MTTNDLCPLCSEVAVLDLLEAVICEECLVEIEMINNKEHSTERV